MLAAVCHGQLYQRRMKKVFDKRVLLREFHEGKLVLKKILPIQKDHRGKWTPNYEGSYVVKKTFSGGARILTRMDGEELPLPVNSDVVKKFYAWWFLVGGATRRYWHCLQILLYSTLFSLNKHHLVFSINLKQWMSHWDRKENNKEIEKGVKAYAYQRGIMGAFTKSRLAFGGCHGSKN